MVVFCRLGEPAGHDRLDNLTDYTKECDRAPALYYLSGFGGLAGLWDDNYTGRLKVGRPVAVAEDSGGNITEPREEGVAASPEKCV